MKEALENAGFGMFFVPEAATLLIDGGCLPQLFAAFRKCDEGESAPLVSWETQVRGAHARVNAMCLPACVCACVQHHAHVVSAKSGACD